MLGMKAWLEIRWRFLFALVPIAIALSGRYVGGLSSAEDATRMIGAIAYLWLFAAVFLAGAGIRTQSPFQPMKGLHGSTQFTLSLLVSRFRLLAVRAGVGMLGVLGIILISSTVAWVLFPLVRANSTPGDFLKWVFTASCCIVGFHAISVLAATVLDEMWQIWGAVVVIGVLKWLTFRFPQLSSFDVFTVMENAPPLFTHTRPVPAISVSLGLAGILFLISVKVVQTREY